jgi:hypothetical protein
MLNNSQFVTYVHAANKIELKIPVLATPTKFNTRGRSVSRATVIRYQRGRWEIDVWQRERFYSSTQRPDQLWGPFSLRYNGYRRCILQAIKRPGVEAGHSMHLVPILRLCVGIAQLPPQIRTTRSLIKQRDDFTKLIYLLGITWASISGQNHVFDSELCHNI